MKRRATSNFSKLGFWCYSQFSDKGKRYPRQKKKTTSPHWSSCTLVTEFLIVRLLPSACSRILLMSVEMKMPILESSILFFQVFFGFTFGTSFVIDRNGYFDVSDNFDVPPSICAHGSTSQECEPFQANSLDLRCSCHCSGENATFIFHHSKWACLAHDEVRKLQGKTEILNEIDGEVQFFIFTLTCRMRGAVINQV